MGFLHRVSSVAAPARMRAGSAAEYNTAFFSGEELPSAWLGRLSSAGVDVTPDLAMTLSAYFCGVKTIAYDLATLMLRMFKNRPDGGKDVIRGTAFSNAGGIGHVAYRLGMQPNDQQSAAEYYAGQLAQFLLRGFAYAEIVDGPSGFLEQLLPRHPDRVTPGRLPNGRMSYKLLEANGQPRYLTQDEMHVVRDISTDNVNTFSTVRYGANAIGTALAAERAAAKFFKSGMTAATVATYKGEMDDDDEKALHASISRYAAGVENSFGLMLVPDDVTITNLGVEPEKAQMMLAREWGVLEVARHLRISPRKLMVRARGDSYGSAYQDAIDHVVSCLRPIAVFFEQAMQRDVILAKDTYQVKFHLGELLRGDPEQLGNFIEKLIKNRVMRPSEVRMTFMDLNPDEALDKLSEADNQPGQTGGGAGGSNVPPKNRQQPPEPDDTAVRSPLLDRASMKSLLAVHDNAVRCLRRERAAVEKLAKKHASDVEGWQLALRDFYADHATFVANTMRISITAARGYAAQHGTEFEAKGIVAIAGENGADWERFEADELAALALAEEDTISIAITMPPMKMTDTPIRDPQTNRITRVERVTELVGVSEASPHVVRVPRRGKKVVHDGE
jgi:HK97 family phage portal protein